MPKFKFDGFNKDGKKTSGEIMASNMTEVRRILRRRGIRVRGIKAPSILEFDLGEWMVNSGLAAHLPQKIFLILQSNFQQWLMPEFQYYSH